MTQLPDNHEEIMMALGKLEAGQRYMIQEMTTVRVMANENKRDITLAKGGSVLASFAAAISGLVAYFR